MLKPKKKLKVTRKDLKEDQFVLSVFKVQEFLTNHVKPITIGVVAVIVVVALFTYISKDKAQRNMVASKMLVEASHDMENGNYETAIAKLNDISDKYDDTHASELANIKMAKKYLQDNDYENAKKYFTKVVNDGGNIDFILAAGFAGLGDCCFNEENYEEAADNYKKASHAITDIGQKAEFLFSAAIAYQQIKDIVKVKEVLNTITENYSDTQVNNKAKKVLASLK